MTDWAAFFDEIYDAPAGATDKDLIALTADLRRPLSQEEIAKVIATQSNPYPINHALHQSWEPYDPTDWPMLDVALPNSYRDFLRWSNGPLTRTGEREFGFFDTASVREMLIAYHFPLQMPAAMPLGLDGGGIFAVFDTRSGLQNGEYPILKASGGVLDYSASPLICHTLVEFCRGRVAIADF